MINEINETKLQKSRSVARRKEHVCNSSAGKWLENNEGKNWGPFIAHVPRFFTPVAIRTFMISFKLHGPLFDWKYYFGKLAGGETKEGRRRGEYALFPNASNSNVKSLDIMVDIQLFILLFKEMIEFFVSLLSIYINTTNYEKLLTQCQSCCYHNDIKFTFK